MASACGKILLTCANSVISGWDLLSGENYFNLSMGLEIATCMAIISPRTAVVGTLPGNLILVDIQRGYTIRIVTAGAKPIMHLFVKSGELWAIDEGGWVHLWQVVNQEICVDIKAGVARVLDRPHVAHVTDDQHLWICSGKLFEVYRRSEKGEASGLLLVARFECEADFGLQNATLVTGITSISSGSLVVTSHEDGNILVWKSPECAPLNCFKTGLYKISCIQNVNEKLWVAFSTGRVVVIDPLFWEVSLEWKPHQTLITMLSYCEAFLAPNLLYRPVITLCEFSCLHIWDGNLREKHTQEALTKKVQEYCSYQELTIGICSWNVAAQRPPEDVQFWNWWIFKEQKTDIIVFGLQELVDLESKTNNARMILSSNSKSTSIPPSDEIKARYWVDRMALALHEGGKDFALLSQKVMVGLCLVVFVRSSLVNRVCHVSHEFVKTGLGGFHGNKGAVLTRFVIDDTPLCFINCHLAAGHSQVAARNTDGATILKTARFPSLIESEGVFYGGDGEAVLDHEHCVLFGDLNYRLSVSRECAERIMDRGLYTDLWPEDQLLSQISKVPSHPFASFMESPLNFAPTYKYDRGTDRLDSSEKQRAPAYCDRILFRSADPTSGIISYTSYPNMKISDHRPISAALKLRTKSIDRVSRERIKAQVTQDWLDKLKK